MIIKNNIKTILGEREISIHKMAIDLEMGYRGAHDVVNRDDLSATQLGTLVKVANYLNLTVNDLFEVVENIEEIDTRKKFKVIYTNWNTADSPERIDYIAADTEMDALMDYQAKNNVKVIKVEEVQE